MEFAVIFLKSLLHFWDSNLRRQLACQGAPLPDMGPLGLTMGPCGVPGGSLGLTGGPFVLTARACCLPWAPLDMVPP